MNGSENWMQSSVNGQLNNHKVYAIELSDVYTEKEDIVSNIITDKFKSLSPQQTSRVDYVTLEGISVYIDNGHQLRICISVTKGNDLSSFKTWLQANPTTVVYELATPIITELPNFNPQTYSDSTTLLINSGVIQAECEFEVTNSKGSEIEVLKDKISSIDEQISSSLSALKELGGIL